MPSFDIVSEVDSHELVNAVDTANRELKNRFDFRNVEASFTLEKTVVSLKAPSDFQLQQMLDILKARLIARGIDIRSMDVADPEVNLAEARQKVTMKSGIEQKTAKKIAAALKEAKLKVDSQINGDKLKVMGKKRDDLQEAIALLKSKEFELPLQFENFRD
ncbi:UPF0234 protein [Arenimonas maotaiensis]|uniref:Nucleotide-binding protein GCM10010960_09060 n=1 Tax=Arenimonas maotaiensis TaxID=1446479 RepID=A0A917CLD1_9GAMM|nr:YajQ family cyclic di-GMP-binding protein [Arenimonas maotaiensis]GGF89395.1 UPF0234 protein [Arenimonas maotaiensis]